MPEKNPFFGATFAERKAIREAAAEGKAVDDETDEVENKSIARKSAAKKKA